MVCVPRVAHRARLPGTHPAPADRRSAVGRAQGRPPRRPATASCPGPPRPRWSRGAARSHGDRRAPSRVPGGLGAARRQGDSSAEVEVSRDASMGRRLTEGSDRVAPRSLRAVGPHHDRNFEVVPSSYCFEFLISLMKISLVVVVGAVETVENGHFPRSEWVSPCAHPGGDGVDDQGVYPQGLIDSTDDPQMHTGCTHVHPPATHRLRGHCPQLRRPFEARSECARSPSDDPSDRPSALGDQH